MSSSDQPVHDAQCTAEVAKHHVIEHKPDGSDVHMTPKAAVETAQELIEAAARAEGNRRFDERTADDAAGNAAGGDIG